MIHQLRQAAPGVDFRAVNERASCRYMKMITPAKLLRSLREMRDEVRVDPEIARAGARRRGTDDRDRAEREAGSDALRPALPAPLPAWEASADVVVVGTGRRRADRRPRRGARPGSSVLLVTKGEPDEASTQWAQGGVAVVRDERDPGDSIEAHIDDTLVAGGGSRRPGGRRADPHRGPGRGARLIDRGAAFDAGPDGLLRTREGGHSANRVIHAGGDATGAEIERALLDVPRAAVGAGRTSGARRRAGRAPGARAGCRCWRRTARSGCALPAPSCSRPAAPGTCTRPPPIPGVATGDGLAMALRAGAAVADVEFMQFHPTVLWTGPGDLGHRPLITEAVRGEGAVLVDGAGDADHARGASAGRPRAPRRGVAGRLPPDGPRAGRDRRPRLPGCDRHRSRRLRPPVPDGVRRLRAGRHRTRRSSPIPVAPGRALSLRRRAHRSRRPHHACPGCSRSARSPAPACTARTGWRRIRCSRAW